MTTNQKRCLSALRFLERVPEADGYYTGEVAAAAGLTKRSAAAVLAQMREFGWVQSTHASSFMGWSATAKGKSAFEASVLA